MATVKRARPKRRKPKTQNDLELDNIVCVILDEVDEEIKNNPEEVRQIFESNVPGTNSSNIPLTTPGANYVLPLLPPLPPSYSTPPLPPDKKHSHNHHYYDSPKPIPRTHKKDIFSTPPRDSNHSTASSDPFDIAKFQSPFTNLPTFPYMTNSQQKPAAVAIAVPVDTAPDPIAEIEAILKEMDEDDNGKIDLHEFEEAMQLIDNNMIANEIEAIYDSMTTKKKVLGTNMSHINEDEEHDDIDDDDDDNDVGELDINEFINYICDKYKIYQQKRKLTANNNNNLPQSTFSNHVPGSISTNVSKKIVKKDEILRIVFKSIFEPNTTSSTNFGITTTQLWGVNEQTSLERLQKEFSDEAADSRTLDYKEFESAMVNLGVHFKKDELIALYSYLLEEQNKLRLSADKKIVKELNIKFLTKYLGEKVKNHQDLLPKQIIGTGFGQILSKAIKKKKKSKKRSKSSNNNDNPYIDSNLMSQEFSEPNNKKFEQSYDALSPSNELKPNHKLIRIKSFLKRDKTELDNIEQDMLRHMESLQRKLSNPIPSGENGGGPGGPFGAPHLNSLSSLNSLQENE